MTELKVGEKAKTPGGIGRVYSIDKKNGTVDVEMNYSYLVEYKISDCEPIEKD